MPSVYGVYANTYYKNATKKDLVASLKKEASFRSANYFSTPHICLSEFFNIVDAVVVEADDALWYLRSWKHAKGWIYRNSTVVGNILKIHDCMYI